MSFMCLALILAVAGAGEGVDAAKANNAFAVDLYKQLSTGDGNLFFSPLSISSALAMAHAGAAGATADEMAKVLHIEDVTDAEFGALVKGAIPEKPDAPGAHAGYPSAVRLDIANAMWLDKKFKYLESYTNTVQEGFQADLFRVNFRHEAEDARLEINKWGMEKTSGRIPELIPSGQVNSLTRLVLTNAMYFRGKWSNEFWPKSTEDKPFHVTPEREATVPMMCQKEHFLYLKGDGFQVLRLPYHGSGFGMLIALPDAVDGLKALEERLTADLIAEWLTSRMEREVVVSLPKFKTSSEFDLKGELARLGMFKAFQEDAADFSRMTKKEKVYISAVLHKAWVEVNEEGTEAAALTAVHLAAMGIIMNPPPPIVFNVDHPFLYAVYDWKTGAVLFLGRMVDPAAG